MYFCIDLKSFYASVECINRGLDPFKTALVVADESRGNGSVVLAVTPYLKKLGVKSRCRIFDLPKDMKIIYAKPRMKLYIEESSKVYKVYLKYFSSDDIHIYSIDECFIYVTPYLKYYNKNNIELADLIISEILNTTGLQVSCGIGENMFLSKVALDIYAKKEKSNRYYLEKDYFLNDLSYYKPLTDIWGIGNNIEKRLNNLGIYNLEDIRNNREKLIKEFGIIGEEMYNHSMGIDDYTIKKIKNYKPLSKSIGHGQVLFEDYNKHNIKVVILEMVDVLVLKLIKKNLLCGNIRLGIGYNKHYGGGFSRQKKLENYTNNAKVIYDNMIDIFEEFIGDFPIRKVYLSLSDFKENKFKVVSLFDDNNKLDKDEKLYKTILNIKEKHGRSSLNKAVSHTKDGTELKRSKLVGGHNAE